MKPQTSTQNWLKPPNRQTIIDSLASRSYRSGISTKYEVLRKAATMHSLEQRRFEQSLAVLFKSLKFNGPKYISDFFNHRVTPYNLRGTGNKLLQCTYNTSYKHNSFAYITSHHITSHHITSHHICGILCQLMSSPQKP